MRARKGKAIEKRRAFILAADLSQYSRSNIAINELKRYFILALLYPKAGLPMLSSRVDAVWHDFILDTEAYANFCSSAFGYFLHHSPKKATRKAVVLSVAEFEEIFLQTFGKNPPPIWDHYRRLKRLEKKNKLAKARKNKKSKNKSKKAARDNCASLLCTGDS